MDKDRTKRIGYALGKLYALVCAACLISVTIALTMKFIMWIF